MRIFIGVDPRQPVAYNVLRWSIERRAHKPVQVIPLILPQLPIKRKGLTEFTFARYLPPFLCGFKGASLFLDADMVVMDNIYALLEYMDGEHAVYVAKHQKKFEWPSAMLFNNEKCTTLTPEWIDDEANQPQTLGWAESIGNIPPEWNFCVGYDEYFPEAKLIHYTQGIPFFRETRNCDFASIWWNEYESMIGSVSWLELMGKSVHAEHVMRKLGLVA